MIPLVTVKNGAISTLKYGLSSILSAAWIAATWLSLIKFGKIALDIKYDAEPATSVEQYAIATVIPSNLPAPSPRSAIPLVTKAKIISGIMNPRKLPKIDENVTKILTIDSGKYLPIRIPRRIPNNILGIKPIFFIFLSLSLIKLCKPLQFDSKKLIEMINH